MCAHGYACVCVEEGRGKRETEGQRDRDRKRERQRDINREGGVSRWSSKLVEKAQS